MDSQCKSAHDIVDELSVRIHPSSNTCSDDASSEASVRATELIFTSDEWVQMYAGCDAAELDLEEYMTDVYVHRRESVSSFLPHETIQFHEAQASTSSHGTSVESIDSLFERSKRRLRTWWSSLRDCKRLGRGYHTSNFRFMGGERTSRYRFSAPFSANNISLPTPDQVDSKVEPGQFSSRINFSRLICKSAVNGSGQVWEAIYDGHTVAAKVSPTENFIQEYSILKELEASRCTVKILALDPYTIRGPALVMQALLSTDLHEWLDHIRDPKADCISGRHLLLTLALQVARAVQDVHLINAVHCNIQVSSLLWCNKREHIILGGFSQARWQGETRARVQEDQQHMLPPEHRKCMDQVHSPPLDTTFDIWQLALCVVEMWQGQSTSKNRFGCRIPNGIPLRKLWLKCTRRDPRRRPSIEEVVDIMYNELTGSSKRAR
mmetsp:Transcript_28255/g.53807  ORF Transcript_28255/g.53807 Transcript_28255/m.53807 type:complete len:436 (+) Transcript_28255:289-1596(+)|eukprot:CAMPEP_0114250356 /NCGR_PEP_ID=MMETSP0058-20121206/14654_1 /TAXON_ID=36894 /ORGANISM="Pyramimonas parkeae, CCMP726" /LENGTH=435 /DNA_ID=CAMNT_0001364007 /DNA_START=245 /DNA_END=1552 /DNA_ORIENTATION=-